MSKIKIFGKSISLEFILISLIAIVALGMRLWRIGEYLTFLGDEGRDVRIVRDLLRGDLVFIGPMTSIGNMYLGPLYYYMMAPFLFLFNFNPVGPAVMIALLSTITIIFTWWVGRVWFSPKAGLIAALLFAISPVAIIYGRASWNPNPMPFFALLCFWGIWQVYKNKKYWWIQIVGVSLAAALQMHYLGLLLVPALGVFWLLEMKNVWKEKNLKIALVKNSLLAVLWFLILMSPLALFDLKHDGMNFKAFQAFFTDRQTTVNVNPLNSNRFLPLITKVSNDLVLGQTMSGGLIVGGIAILLALWKISKDKKNINFWILLSWVGFGILGLSLYKQHVYAHYFGFIFPAFYLLVGCLLVFISEKSMPFRVLAASGLAFLVAVNFINSPLKQQPNRQLQRTEQIVDLIIKESGDKPFNFGLIAKQNYDESYRYFLENKKALMVRGEDKVVDQLFVVCEDGDKCQPEGNPAYQIAIFGPSHVVEKWEVDYIKVYKMEHTPVR